jgi:hypothetical protein
VIVRKTLWDIRLVSATTESRKLKNRDEVEVISYNALPNLISQYTIRLVINYRTKSTQDYSFFNLENIITAVKY